MLLNYVLTVYFCILKNIAIFFYINIFEIYESGHFCIFFYLQNIIFSSIIIENNQFCQNQKYYVCHHD